MLVLDQSSSMTPAIAALQAAATYFVSQFQPGRDRIGLVVLGGSAIIAYPPGDWGKDPVSATLAGPDTNWANTPDSAAAPNIYTSINNLSYRSNTGTAEALMYAYRELVAANQPGALNVIVLFTDGQPNGISAYFNPVVGSSVLSTSTCTYKTDGGNSAHSMIGWMAQWGNYLSGTNPSNGVAIFKRAQTDQTDKTTIGAWLSATNYGEPVISGTPPTNCSFASNQKNDYKDIQFPTKDLYGNYLNGPSAVGAANYTALDYQLAQIWSSTNQGCLDPGSTGARQNWSLTNSVADACQVGLASWNAADMAAYQIHQHTGTTITPLIYCLGYEGDGGDDPAFMTRLANISANPYSGTTNSVYDSTKPKGMYIQVQTQADMQPAFQSILAEILRLSL
jgi:hypothetical protein